MGKTAMQMRNQLFFVVHMIKVIIEIVLLVEV